MIEEDYDSDDDSSDFQLLHKSESDDIDEKKLRRFIIHLDVDCFYCQCEEKRNPSLSKKPFAIGQKHIIVTSNYIARKLGVKKLQKRRDALRICPTLTIVEGSDLEPYRDASSLVYSVFREAVMKVHPKNTAKKVGMDEYFADISAAVELEWGYSRSTSLPDSVWVYGEDFSVAQITEDQSGASSNTVWNNNNHGDDMEWGTLAEKDICARKLQIASKIARQVQDKVKAKSSFSATIGISCSPMISKIASDLKKPNSCNILFPWRTSEMISRMPLRRVPGIGSKTLRLLSPVLEQFHGEKPGFWTCRDLQQIPPYLIMPCLLEKRNASNLDLLLNLCRGIDTTEIVDDGGCLSKTVSVEDSFIRGTLTSMRDVMKHLDILLHRLLRLLDQRNELSTCPEDSYPKTIRLSTRIVDRTMTSSGRQFRNLTRQKSLNGKLLMSTKDRTDRITILRNHAIPLLQVLRELSIGLNITRLNIATLSFADIEKYAAKTCSDGKQSEISFFFGSSLNSKVSPSSECIQTQQHPGKIVAASIITSTIKTFCDTKCNAKPRQKRTCMKDVIHNLKLKHAGNKSHKKCKKNSRERKK